MLKFRLSPVALFSGLVLVAASGCADDTSGTPPSPTGGSGTDTTGGTMTTSLTDAMTESTAMTDPMTGSTTDSTTDPTIDPSTSATNPSTTDNSTTDNSTTDNSTTDNSTGTTDGSTDGDTETGTTQGDDGTQVAVEVGDSQTGFIDQQLATPVVVRVVDDMDAPIQGAIVRFSADPGAATTPAFSTTDMNGEVVVLARVGRAIGSYTFTADVDNSPASATFTANAIAPVDGTALTLVNVVKVVGDNLGVPGPGTLATIGNVRGVAVASDDTVFISADRSGNGFVYALDSAGELTLIAGGGMDELEECVPPTDADLGPVEDIVYDEGNNLLYLAADYINGDRVLTIDLDSDTLCTFAGGNENAPSPQYGDGGLATDARLLNAGDLSIGPDGALYIADRTANRIRRVSLGVIDEYISPGDCSDPVALQSCTNVGCEMAWDTDGSLFVNARICGSEPGGTTDGVFRYSPMAASVTHVAGQSGGSQSEPVLSLFAELDGLGGMAFDEAGNLFIVEAGSDRVRRVDSTTFQVRTAMNNTGNPGQGNDYNPALGVQLDGASRIAFSDLGDLIIADSDNAAVRLVWGAGDVAPLSANMALVQGDGQTIEADERMGIVTTQLVDDALVPHEGVLVRYRADDVGGCVDPSQDITDDLGIAATLPRPGLTTGATTFTAFYDDIHGVPVDGSPITIDATVVAPSAGTMLTIINDDHSTGNLGVPGAGTCARVGDVRGVTTAPDGTVFVTDFSGGDGRLRALDTAGNLVDVAGGGGASVDGVPALDADIGSIQDAQWATTGGGRVYVSGTYGGASRILRVDVNAAAPRVFVYGGQPTPDPNADGDGGLATEAHFVNAGDLAIDPTNTDALYVVDTGHDRIRVIEDLSVEHFYGVGDNSCTTDTIALTDCSECNVTFDAAGVAYIFGQLCGSAIAGTTPGIISYDPSDDSVVWLAGDPGGTSDYGGTVGTSAEFFSSGGLLVGSDGLLYFTEADGHRIGRLPTSGGTIALVAGDGMPDSTGNYGPASMAQLYEPLRLAERAGTADLVIADSNNSAVRMIWGQFSP